VSRSVARLGVLNGHRRHAAAHGCLLVDHRREQARARRDRGSHGPSTRPLDGSRAAGEPSPMESTLARGAIWRRYRSAARRYGVLF